MSEVIEVVEEKTFITLSNKDCGTCGHLVSHARIFPENCHYTRGNNDCPAKYIKMGVGVNYEKASDGISQAILTHDVPKLKRLVDKLASLDFEVGKKVLQAMEEKLFAGLIELGWEVPESGAETEDQDDNEPPSEDQDLVNVVQDALRSLPADLDDGWPEEAEVSESGAEHDVAEDVAAAQPEATGLLPETVAPGTAQSYSPAFLLPPVDEMEQAPEPDSEPDQDADEWSEA